jgi:hypothetical protein
VPAHNARSTFGECPSLKRSTAGIEPVCPTFICARFHATSLATFLQDPTAITDAKFHFAASMSHRICS